MLESISNDKLNISDYSDSDVSSNAEELQMLQKLRIDENNLINNEKEMQNKIIQYEQKIRELQEELNSQGSTSETNRNFPENQNVTKFSNSFGSESSNNNKLEIISNYFGSGSDKQEINGAHQNFQHNNYMYNHTNTVNCTNSTNQIRNNQIDLSKYSAKNSNRLQFINEMEDFVNTKFTEAERIMSSLLYPGYQLSPIPDFCDTNIQAIQEQNIQLKAQLKQLKQSLYRYLNRHEAVKKKRETRENLLNQRIAFLEEREKNLTQIISNQQKT